MEGFAFEPTINADFLGLQPVQSVVFGSLDARSRCSRCSIVIGTMARWECTQCPSVLCPVCHSEGVVESVWSLHCAKHKEQCVWPEGVAWGTPDVCLLLELIPEELLIQIFVRLSLADVASLMRTCKRLALMRTWDFLWRGLTRNHYLLFLPWVDCRCEPLYYDRLRVTLALKTFPPPVCGASISYSHGLGPLSPLKMLQHSIHLENVSPDITRVAVINGHVYALSDTGVVLAGKLSSGVHEWSSRLPKFGIVTADSSAAKAVVRKSFRPQIVALPGIGLVATDGIALFFVSFDGQQIRQIFHTSTTSAQTKLSVVSATHVAFVRSRFFEHHPRKQSDVDDYATWKEFWRKFPSFAESIRGPYSERFPTYSRLLRACVARGNPLQLHYAMALRGTTVDYVSSCLESHPSLKRKFAKHLRARANYENTFVSAGSLRADHSDELEQEENMSDNGDVMVKILKSTAFKDSGTRPPLAAAQDVDLVVQYVNIANVAASSSTLLGFDERQTVTLPLSLLCRLAGFANVNEDAWAHVATAELCSWEAYSAVAVLVSDGRKKKGRLVVLLVHPVLGMVGYSDWTEAVARNFEMTSLFCHTAHSETIVTKLGWLCVSAGDSCFRVVRLYFHLSGAHVHEAPFVGKNALNDGVAHQFSPTDADCVYACNPAAGTLYVAQTSPSDSTEENDQPEQPRAPRKPVQVVALDVRASTISERWTVSVEQHVVLNPPPFHLGSESLLRLVSCNQIRVSDSSLYLMGAQDGLMCVARIDLFGSDGPTVWSIQGYAGAHHGDDEGEIGCLLWDVSENPVTDAVLLYGEHLCIISQKPPARMAANLAILELMRREENPIALAHLANLIGLFGPLIEMGGLDHLIPQMGAHQNPNDNNNNNNGANGGQVRIPRNPININPLNADGDGDLEHEADRSNGEAETETVVDGNSSAGDDDDDDHDHDDGNNDDDDDAHDAPGPHDLHWCLDCGTFHE